MLNGKAGALLDQPDAMADLQTAFAEAGLAPHFIPPDAGALPDRIDQAIALQTEMVVVGGGDGTVACAARSVWRAPPPRSACCPSAP